jgi:ankyrin repeat protein
MNISTKFFLISLTCASLLGAQSAKVPSDIFYAVRKGNVKAVKACLKTTPDLAVCDTKGHSLLAVAAMRGDKAMVRMLIDAGAMVNETDAHGKTALDYAIEHNQIKTARYMYKKYKAGFACPGNAVRLKDSYKKRALKFFVVGFFFTPLFWLGSLIALSNASDVVVTQ